MLMSMPMPISQTNRIQTRGYNVYNISFENKWNQTKVILKDETQNNGNLKKSITELKEIKPISLKLRTREEEEKQLNLKSPN